MKPLSPPLKIYIQASEHLLLMDLHHELRDEERALLTYYIDELLKKLQISILAGQQSFAFLKEYRDSTSH